MQQNLQEIKLIEARPASISAHVHTYIHLCIKITHTLKHIVDFLFNIRPTLLHSHNSTHTGLRMYAGDKTVSRLTVI